MDPRVVAVLRRFADIESSEEIETTILGGGRSETTSRQHAEVTEFLPEQGVVAIRHGSRTARLHFDEAELLQVIAAAGRDAEAVWGDGVSAEEAAARFLSIHLDESLATREPHESGWWSHRPGGFDPLPPWEARRRPGA